MTNASDDKYDFFISYNKADRSWATWITWVLEEAGYSVFFQDWDFKGNFVLEMDEAHTWSRRTIAVLSPDYLASRFTAPEWAARFAEDATSEHDRLIPIRVRPCELEVLLAQIVYLDLVGCSEREARKKILDRVEGIRGKPDEPPLFPGTPGYEAITDTYRPAFPALEANLKSVTAGIPTKEEESAASIEEAHFTVYHPKEITFERWDTMLVYAHIPDKQEWVYEDAEARLDRSGSYGRRGDRAKRGIAEGVEIVVVPELSGCEFNPRIDRFRWLENVHRREFRLRANPAVPGFMQGTAVNGRVAFYVASILIAEVGIWAFLSDEQPAITPVVMPLTVTASALKDTSQQYISGTADPYSAIFVSYAHEDGIVVKRVGAAYKALGMSFLRDQEVLRSGEKWNPILLTLIERADIFQLFWSNASQRSRYVKQEWCHALRQERDKFIRPVYWQQPLLKPPRELRHLHFAYLPYF